MVIDRLSPDDLAAVVFTAATAAGQDFTDDRALLRKAVDRLRSTISYDLAASGVIQTLSNVVSLLADAPDRRKFIVFIATGIRMDVAALAAPVAIGSPSANQGQVSQHHQRLLDLFVAAHAVNANVYAVDPYGITVGPGGADSRKLNREFLIALANNTGAKAVVNTNAFQAGIDAIFEQNRSYYVLGFESAARDRGGRITVRLSRPEATVRVQSVLGTPSAASNDPAAALESLLPRRGIPLSGRAAQIRPEGSKTARTEIVVRIGDGWLGGADGGPIDLVANAYDTNGTRRASLRRSVTGEQLRQEILLVFELRPGRYQVRIAAQSAATGSIGTLNLDVERAR